MHAEARCTQPRTTTMDSAIGVQQLLAVLTSESDDAVFQGMACAAARHGHLAIVTNVWLAQA